MKNMKTIALGAILALATMAPAYGMHRALQRGFAGYHAKRAVYTTLGARLFNRSTVNLGSKTTQLSVQFSPAQQVKKPSFFSKWFAAIPVIGWMFQSNEETWAKELLKQPAIKDTLASPSWNPNNPEVAKYVLGKCIAHRMGPKQCGDSVKAVQALIGQERVKALNKFDSEFNSNVTKAATQYTKGAMTLGCKTKDGVEIALTQASDDQLKATLKNVEERYFPQCKNPDIQVMCEAAQKISLNQLMILRDTVQGITPAVATQKEVQK